MEVFCIALFGLCIGSFLNVCIYRIAKEESIVFPPSHCTSCGYKLKAIDLIPIISYLFLKGKCRQCKEKISLRYPMVEVLNCILYILIYFKFGLSVNLVFYCLFTSLLIVIGFIDLDTKYVYSSTVIFGIVLGGIFMVSQWITTGKIPVNFILGGVIGFSVIWIIVRLTGGMGEGDIDIALICGIFLGVKGIAVTLFLSFVIGGIVAVIILIMKKNIKREIAFGPYLAIGAVIAMLYGTKLIDIYLSLCY